jgi:hypothetical protein
LNENPDEIAKCNSSNTERENDAFAKFSSASAKEQKDEDFGNFASDGNIESEDEFADFSVAQNDAEFTNFSSSGSQFLKSSTNYGFHELFLIIYCTEIYFLRNYLSTYHRYSWCNGRNSSICLLECGPTV